MLVTGSCDGAQPRPRRVSREDRVPQGPCSPRAAAAPGGPASSTDRASAWWDLGLRLVPTTPSCGLGQCFPCTVLALCRVSPGTHPLSSFVPPFYRSKKTQAGELLSSSLGTAYPISQGSWAGAPAGPAGCPDDAGRGHGGRQLWPPVPRPPRAVSCRSALLLAMEMTVS